MDSPRLGKQPPRYTFFLNPYTDAHFTKCPKCAGKMAQQKLPLVIHIDDGGMMVLNKMCRHCPACDLRIAHKDEIKAQMAVHFQRVAPEVVGNDYLVIGTVDEVADVVLMLATNRYITGQTINVNGGWYMS